MVRTRQETSPGVTRASTAGLRAVYASDRSQILFLANAFESLRWGQDAMTAGMFKLRYGRRVHSIAVRSLQPLDVAVIELKLWLPTAASMNDEI
jgi:hypothetical protein